MTLTPVFIDYVYLSVHYLGSLKFWKSNIYRPNVSHSPSVRRNETPLFPLVEFSLNILYFNSFL